MISPTLLLYPELARLAPGSRPAALRRARHEPFDWVEFAGLGASIVLVAWVTQWIAVAAGLAGPDGTMLANVLLALPLVVACAGPFYWRRTRRALRHDLARLAGDETRASP